MQTLHYQIAPNIYRITVAPSPGFSFNHFLVICGNNPMLIHTGRVKWFENTLEEMRKFFDPSLLRYIGFSHFEADECGALNNWLELGPNAVPIVGKIGQSSIEDFSSREPLVVRHEQHIDLGGTSIQFLETPHCPHNWDASMFYLPANKILFCSDLGAQPGIPRNELLETPETFDDIVSFQKKVKYMTTGLLLEETLNKLEKLEIDILAIQHGNSLKGKIIPAFFHRLREEFTAPYST